MSHSDMEASFNERDPGIIFLVDPFRLHQCMGLLSLRDSHGRPRISIDPGLAQGQNERDSWDKFQRWLDSIAEDILPCESKTEGLTKPIIKGCYQRLSSQKCDEFIKILQCKMRFWAAECTNQGMSGGCALKTSYSGKGEMSYEPQLVGPFQD